MDALDEAGTRAGRRGRLLAAAIAALIALATVGGSAVAQSLEISPPQVVLSDTPFELTVTDPDGALADGTPVVVQSGEHRAEGTLSDGSATVELPAVAAGGQITASAAGNSATATANVIPGWVSILPAVIAILVALTFRQVIPALFLGIWFGAIVAYGLSLSGIWYGLLDTVTDYTLTALNDSDHLSVIIFSLLIGGMVGIISKNGGTAGIVHAITRVARTPRDGQVSTATLGVAIFFDDYANTLIVGNTMRPITDKLRVSREKLAYIVDSTAAPVATLALVTTWIGFQVGVIDSAIGQIDGLNEGAYSVFLNALAYSFYPVLTILFVFLVATTGRDFGPMLAAERRARSTHQVVRPEARVGESSAEAQEREPKPGKPQLATNAVFPILVLVVGSLAGIYITGVQGLASEAGLREIIGNGNSFQAMMWASLLACLVAGSLSIGLRILTLGEVVDAWYAGVRSMLLAVIILVLAWSLSNVNEVIHTSDYLISILGDALDPRLLPALIFILAAMTAFATGSSWGVMGVLTPLAVPLTWAVLANNGMTGPEGMAIFYSAISAVLAGAVFGDHCSPISDTTILSSLACECDHIDHVRTQLPYALFVGAVGLLVGALPVAYGLYPWWLAMLIGIAVIVGWLMFVGRRADDEAVQPAPATPAATQS